MCSFTSYPQVILFFFLVVQCGMRDLSSPTRDLTRVPCSGSWSPNHWTAGVFRPPASPGDSEASGWYPQAECPLGWNCCRYPSGDGRSSSLFPKFFCPATTADQGSVSLSWCARTQYRHRLVVSMTNLLVQLEPSSFSPDGSRLASDLHPRGLPDIRS